MQDALDEAEQSFVYSCFCAGVQLWLSVVFPAPLEWVWS